MKISDLLKLSTDNLRRRKGRTALTVIGVVVGTCAIVVMISLGIAANKRTEETLASWSDLTQITVLGYSDSADTPALDDKMVASLKEMEYVIAATPMYNFQNFIDFYFLVIICYTKFHFKFSRNDIYSTPTY